MTFKQAERMIKDIGWYLDSVTGSHYHYKHSDKPGKVTIPFHCGDLKEGVINSIRRQAGITKNKE